MRWRVSGQMRDEKGDAVDRRISPLLGPLVVEVLDAVEDSSVLRRKMSEG
jgi:hypothetical protein